MEQLKYHLDTIGKLLSNTSYYYYNLEYLINGTSEEGKITFNSFPVLKKIRLTLWSLIILDLHKILSKSSNDKFRIIKLINILIDSYSSIKWMHKIEMSNLQSLKSKLIEIQPKIEKIKEIRDTQIAHFDDVKLNYRLELSELKELISFCHQTYNDISLALFDSTTYWKFSDSELFNPVVITLDKFIKLKNLYFSNLAEMNDKIEMSELGKIIRASS